MTSFGLLRATIGPWNELSSRIPNQGPNVCNSLTFRYMTTSNNVCFQADGLTSQTVGLSGCHAISVIFAIYTLTCIIIAMNVNLLRYQPLLCLPHNKWLILYESCKRWISNSCPLFFQLKASNWNPTLPSSSSIFNPIFSEYFVGQPFSITVRLVIFLLEGSLYGIKEP